MAINRRTGRRSGRKRAEPQAACGESGFTLLEVLISLALILALGAAMFVFFHDLLNSRERALERSAQHRAASILIERLESDLSACIAGDIAAGAGVAGDEAAINILSRGVASAAAGGSDRERFGDLQRAEYRFDQNQHQVSAARTPAAAQNQAQSANGAPANSEPGTRNSDLGGRLFRVQFRYHDGSQWTDRYDSQAAGRLPVAVEVAVWFDPWPGEEWNEEGDDLWNGRAAGEDEPERLTFDPGDAFDEFEWAMRADRDLREQPQPDRLRVILIPDARDDEDAIDAEEAG